MTLRAVLFDFGNTLVSTRLNWERIMPANLTGLAEALKPHLPAIDFDRLARDFTFFKRMGAEKASVELIETPALDSLQQALGMQGLTKIAYEVLQNGVDGFFSAEEQAYPIIFGIPEVLAKLKEMGLRLAVISNATCGKLVRRALESRRLLAMFNHIAVSADLGPCKPDPAIFWGTMHALEVQAPECVMVGDRLDTDVEGARRAGMRVVLTDFFKDDPAIPAEGPRPDAVIRQPQELVQLLTSWLDSAGTQ